MGKADFFQVEKGNNSVAIGFQYAEDETEETVELDFNYEGDGVVSLGAHGLWDLAEVSLEDLRKFASALNKLADRVESFKYRSA